ncbi:MAG: CrcB family protein [Xanthomonadales bacterium]|nr:CrcB family protein [Xanthomonadales bacterium]
MAERPAVLAAIAVGSALGGLARALLAGAAPTAPPWGLLLVNALGSLAIGAYHELTRPGGRFDHPPVLRHFVMGGLLGGFTSFSLVSIEALRLAGGGAAAGVLFLLASTASWLAAAALGLRLARPLRRPPGGRG